MRKGAELAVFGALVCGLTAGVLLAQRTHAASGRLAVRRRPLALETASWPAYAAPRLAAPPGFALAPPLALPAPTRIYETVRIATRPSLKQLVTAAGAAAVLAGGAIVALPLATPRVTALAAPALAYPDTSAVISYASSGWGTLSYRVDAPSQRRAGSLAARQGSIEFPVVGRDANGEILVIVQASGPLGSDLRTARIAVRARPRSVVVTKPSNHVQIEALNLSSTAIDSGGEIGVRYRSNATSGKVVLRDTRGGVWQSEPLSPAGFTRLHVPVTDRATQFNVVLQARRGGDAIENSVAVVVTGTPPPSPAARVRSANGAATDLPTVARSGALVVTSAGVGRTATVIELAAKGGAPLQRATPRADGMVELRMPVVTSAQSFLISVSYQNGAGRETSLHWIRVLPAR